MVKTLFPMQGAQVQSLVWELRFHMLCSTTPPSKKIRIPKRIEKMVSDACMPVFIVVLLFIIAKKWKQPKCPFTD